MTIHESSFCPAQTSRGVQHLKKDEEKMILKFRSFEVIEWI